MVLYILKKIIIIIVLFKFNDIFFYKKWDIWFKCFFEIKMLIGKKFVENYIICICWNIFIKFKVNDKFFLFFEVDKKI